jgi:hypothetical protein
MSDFRKYLEIVNTYSDPTDYIEVGDTFDIELNESFVIETGVLGFTEDGVVLHGDDEMFEYLEINDAITESTELDEKMILGWGQLAETGMVFGMGQAYNEGEMDEAKYHGREVPLGKKMKGDVKKSKVYVRKPNGKIVKVNFGDKNMRIKKSNPKRRKSFRARHHCENPGPRWKARYWSCRSW